MKSIYNELLERVENGEKFHIDFEKRNMRVGKTYLIKDGEYDISRELSSAPYYSNINVILHILNELYEDYYTSTPSERSENKRKKYFKALSVDELTDEQLVYGTPREYAKAKLEGYMLIKLVDGSFKWDAETMGKWFYVGNNPNFIILKKWVEK